MADPDADRDLPAKPEPKSPPVGGKHSYCGTPKFFSINKMFLRRPNRTKAPFHFLRNPEKYVEICPEDDDMSVMSDA